MLVDKYLIQVRYYSISFFSSSLTIFDERLLKDLLDPYKTTEAAAVTELLQLMRFHRMESSLSFSQMGGDELMLFHRMESSLSSHTDG